MRIDIITIFPKFFEEVISYSILEKAQRKKIVEIKIHDLREYSLNNQKSVDDYQYGGGAGMVMNIEPIDVCIKKLKSERSYDDIIYMTPDAKKLDQAECNKLSLSKNLIILCGHYKGIDHRIREHIITKELSIGDYVLTGGELACSVLIDSVIRLIPGTISDGTSALEDSFQDNLLTYPIYTRPSNYNGWEVPKILLKGNEKEIKEWREKKSIEKTKETRPDLVI